MAEESFSKQAYTLEDLANDTFWRDMQFLPADQVYWNKGLWAEQERLRKALDEGELSTKDGVEKISAFQEP